MSTGGAGEREGALGDRLVRGAAGGHALRVMAVIATRAVAEARTRHHTTPVATAALGRAMSASLMLTALQKGAQQVTVIVKGDGPLGQVVADADPGGGVRGYVSDPGVLVPGAGERLEVEAAVGSGTLTVTRWLEARPEPFHGTVPLVTGGVARDVAEYLIRSEQVPSVVSLGERLGPGGQVEVAGGFLIQALPDASPELVDRVERAVMALPGLSELLREVEGDAESLARLVTVGAFDFRALASVPVRFRCRCDRDRGENALLALGRAELESLVEEQDHADVRCEFCGETYRFDVEAVHAALERLGSA